MNYCKACGNPFDYEGKICFYCEQAIILDKEEKMVKNKENLDKEPEFDSVEFPEDTHPKIHSHQTEAATPPETNGETTHFMVVDTVRQGTQALADALNDGYLIGHALGENGQNNYVLSKITPAKP